MKTLKTILNEMLIVESASVEDVDSAIDKHERIIVNYHTKGEDKHTGARVIEVYAYGLTKAGNPCIRVFQPYGDSTTTVPNWKFMRLDRISAWKPTGQIFTRPADFYYKNLGNFNPNGDDTMSVVYKIAKFGNNEQLPQSDNGPKLKHDVYKTDTEHRMERLRNQLNNPIKLSDIKTANGFKNIEEPHNDNGPKLKKQQSDDVYKTDTERGMERLRQQLDNPTYISDLRDKKTNDLEQLRNKLGDTSKPIPFKELQDRLSDDSEKKEDDVYKTDTEKNMEKLRQQLNNPKYIDLSQLPKR